MVSKNHLGQKEPTYTIRFPFLRRVAYLPFTIPFLFICQRVALLLHICVLWTIYSTPKPTDNPISWRVSMYFCQILGIEGNKSPLSTDLLITPLYGLTVGHFLKCSQGIAEKRNPHKLNSCHPGRIYWIIW